MAPTTTIQAAQNSANIGSNFNLGLPTVAIAGPITIPGNPPKTFIPQAAVNASLFTNCCFYALNQWPYPGTALLGLQIANGEMNAPVLANAYMPCSEQGSAGCFPFEFDATLLIDGANHAMIRRIDSQQALNAFPPIVTAVTGSHMLVSNGQPVTRICPKGGCGGEFYRANARTAVGLIGSSTLLIVAVDYGGQSQGMQLDELAAFFSGPLKADAAINLDGGGSTTMATSIGGTVKIVNNPSDSSTTGCTVSLPDGNCERYVGAVLMIGVMQAGATTRQRP